MILERLCRFYSLVFFPPFLLHVYFLLSYTTKKWGYPSIFKTARIALKRAGIGSKFLSGVFFPGASNRWLLNVGIGSRGPIPALFKSTGIGPGTFKPGFGVFTCVGTVFMKM